MHALAHVLATRFCRIPWRFGATQRERPVPTSSWWCKSKWSRLRIGRLHGDAVAAMEYDEITGDLHHHCGSRTVPYGNPRRLRGTETAWRQAYPRTFS